MALDLILKDIVDERVRENFFRIQRYISENVLLGADWKLIEADVTASYAFPIPHGLKYTPTDIIPLAADGDYNYYFRVDESNSKNVYVTAHGPVRLRFLVGRYSQKGRRTLKDSDLPFVAPLQPSSNSGGIISSGAGGSDGWAFIQDSQYTSTSPLQVMAAQRTKIPNNAQGVLTNYTNAPSNSNTWWDSSNAVFKPSKLGEFYSFRLNFRFKPSLNNMNVSLILDIGTSNALATKSFYLNKGAGVESMFSEALPAAISQAPFTNGIAFYLKSDCDGQLYGINLTVIRDFHL